ncbi:MAG: preprotein translocase subunit SecE [Coprobacillaceae bacterium]
MKIKDWLSIKGVRSEIRNISWLTKKELAQNSAIVLLFCFVMGAFFFGGDAIIAAILRALGMK